MYRARTVWSAEGPVGRWYRDESGPLALWGAWGNAVSGYPLNAGHFFPEEAPEQTAEALGRFFRG